MKSEVVRKFVGRLNQAMDELKLPALGRPAWLAKRLEVSTTATQKYFNGTAMPKGSRFAELAAVLQVNVGWLRDGHGPMKEAPAESNGPLLERLHKAWRALPNDAVRLDVLQYVEYRVSLGEIQAPLPKAPASRPGR